MLPTAPPSSPGYSFEIRHRDDLASVIVLAVGVFAFGRKSGVPCPDGSMPNKPRTFSMNQHKLRSAPLISGTSRGLGALRREPLP